MTGRQRWGGASGWWRAPVMVLLLAAVMSGYVAPCVGDAYAEDSQASASITTIAAVFSTAGVVRAAAPHGHGHTDDCGAAIHDPGGLPVTTSPYAAALLVLSLAVVSEVDWLLLSRARHRTGGARSPPAATGRRVLISLCVARI